MIRNKKLCGKCGQHISLSNFLKHESSCDGKTFRRIDPSWRQEDGMYKCPYCQKVFTKPGISSHVWRMHEDGINFIPILKGTHAGWNKGKTYDEVYGVERAKEIKQKMSDNIKGKTLGRHHSEETKKVMSEKMKLAHKEGRAWNIGQSRWNNEPSWPEKFFMQVIQNEFIDKQYEREVSFFRFSLDFAWMHTKRCIEIDGKQHELVEAKERDERKNALLKEHGWQILRIKWKDMFNEPKKWIKIAKEFIDSNDILLKNIS